MSEAATIARFRLNTRCFNCRKMGSRIIDVPDEPKAPTTSAELQESAFLARVPFRCRQCDGTAGVIVGVAQVPLEDEPEAA